MRYFTSLLFFVVVIYVAWPYYHIYKLNNAVKNNDPAAVEKMVDFEQVNKVFQENMKWKADNMTETPVDMLPESLREQAKALVGALGNAAADASAVDAKWMLDRFHQMQGSLQDQVTFAFFESPTRFIIRLGQLGRNPLHIEMTLQDWVWRVTAIYE
jgi:hypothetical protein